MTIAAKTIVITGASDGIGAAAARQLAAHGHQVVVVGRSPEKTKAVAAELEAEHHIADFAVLEDVRQLARELDAHPRIDVLANNAGGIFGEQAHTVDGFEKTLQVNHLAPFLLTNLLLEKLIASRATVVQTSSVMARTAGKISLERLNEDAPVKAIQAYSATKLENILFTRELHNRFHKAGLSAAAFHPGAVASSFASGSNSLLRPLVGNPLARAFLTTPEKGARQLVWLAETEPGSGWQSGGYYERRKSAATNRQAANAELAHALWDRSAQLVGIDAG